MPPLCMWRLSARHCVDAGSAGHKRLSQAGRARKTVVEKMLSAKFIGNELVREIYAALEVNGDLTATWIEDRHSAFSKIFGKATD